MAFSYKKDKSQKRTHGNDQQFVSALLLALQTNENPLSFPQKKAEKNVKKEENKHWS